MVAFGGLTFHHAVSKPPLPATPQPEDPSLKFASPRGSKIGLPSYCDAFDISKITISIKTGATVAFDKVPTQLMTSLRCVTRPMIFSDLNQTLGSHQMHDVLSRVSPAAMKGNSDFDLYFKQQELVAQGREIELNTLSSIPIPTQDWRTQGKSAAWALDKYKFTHMVERAWELQPDRDWYGFLEGDTYTSLSNLLRWLKTKNPKQGKSLFRQLDTHV